MIAGQTEVRNAAPFLGASVAVHGVLFALLATSFQSIGTIESSYRRGHDYQVMHARLAPLPRAGEVGGSAGGKVKAPPRPRLDTAVAIRKAAPLSASETTEFSINPDALTSAAAGRQDSPVAPAVSDTPATPASRRKSIFGLALPQVASGGVGSAQAPQYASSQIQYQQWLAAEANRQREMQSQRHMFDLQQVISQQLVSVTTIEGTCWLATETRDEDVLECDSPELLSSLASAKQSIVQTLRALQVLNNGMSGFGVRALDGQKAVSLLAAG